MAYCRTLGVKFIYQDKTGGDDSDRRSSVSKLASLHRWSSHSIRRVAYNAMCSHGYGVAAVAQNLDDAARAFVAAAFHAASIATLKAHYRVREHDVRIIRPFIYVRERSVLAFACSRSLPDFRSPRPPSPGPDSPGTSDDSGDSKELDQQNIMETERDTPESNDVDPIAAVTEVLATQELMYPYLFSSLKTALHPLFTARALEKEQRHRKKSVIQMKNGAPVYDSEEGTDEESVP